MFKMLIYKPFLISLESLQCSLRGCVAPRGIFSGLRIQKDGGAGRTSHPRGQAFPLNQSTQTKEHFTASVMKQNKTRQNKKTKNSRLCRASEEAVYDTKNSSQRLQVNKHKVPAIVTSTNHPFFLPQLIISFVISS